MKFEEYKYNIYKFLIYSIITFLLLFVITYNYKENKIVINNKIKTSVIEFNDEITKIHVEYPRFESDKINHIITDFVYSYVKEFKENNNAKALDITYSLYNIEDYVNISFHIENTLSNQKTKSILINKKEEKIDYISNIYDKEYLQNEIINIVSNKYSEEILNKIANSSLNNFTYIINDDNIEIHFNNINFDNIDYIPYIVINNNYDTTTVSQIYESNINKYIAFTYDDGPSEYTSKILKTLELNNSSATFFMLGNRMKYNESIVKDVYNSKSEIASHTYSHKNLTQLTNDEINDEIKQTEEIFYEITGDKLKYIRPPYNKYNEEIKNLPITIVLWNIDPKDWLLKDPNKIYKNVINNACDGCIVIMHDIYESTVDATKMLIPELNKMGYKVVSVSDLMKIKNYEITEKNIITSIK